MTTKLFKKMLKSTPTPLFYGKFLHHLLSAPLFFCSQVLHKNFIIFTDCTSVSAWHQVWHRAWNI